MGVRPDNQLVAAGVVPAVQAPLVADAGRVVAELREPVLDEVFATRDHVAERVLLGFEFSVEIPLPAAIRSAANMRNRVNDAAINQRQDRRRKNRRPDKRDDYRNGEARLCKGAMFL